MTGNSVIISVIVTLASFTCGAGEVLTTTMYHGEEVAANDGDSAWGLYQSDGQFSLRPVTLKIERAYDQILDAEDEATAKVISIAGGEQPQFLFTGIDFSEGNVESSFEGFKQIYPGEVQYSGVENDGAQLWGFGRAEQENTQLLTKDYRLMLVKDGKDGPVKQELAAFDVLSMEGRPALLWAGDLDRDGKVDLLMDLTDHYNVSNKTLFLSTHAKDGEAVGIAAQVWATGC